MKSGSRQVVSMAAIALGACFVGVALAASSSGSLAPSTLTSSSRSVSRSQANEEPGLGVILPSCGRDAFAMTATGQAAPDDKPVMSDQAFKNIQVLKGIPVDEFMGAMGVFSASLSVCCSECHIGAGFASGVDWSADSPKKRMARRMIQMVDAINKDHFAGRRVVTCWTCHRGGDRPAITPTIDEVYGDMSSKPPDIVSQAPDVPSASAILDKYLQAIGGAARLANLKSFVAKGTTSAYGTYGKRRVEVFAKAPDQRATIVYEPDDGDTAMTYDGRSGWIATPHTPVPVLTLTGGELAGARLDAQLSFPGQISQTLTNWRVGFATTIEDRTVQVVQGTAGAQGFATLYFDDETGLLTRLVRYADSKVGRVPTQIDYSDYREVAGVKVPFHWTFSWLDGRDIYDLTEVQPNVPIDAVRFAKPAPSKPY